ncbi:uncharacterized protein TNCV_1224321 [Trichonephila clavipes]|nr:uncharacterized protein TNCV_1224321 [Trichonephila clavipes]
MEGEERWEAFDHPQSILPPNWGRIELNCTVTCMVLKATVNDRRHLALCHAEFRGPRSGLCRSSGIGNNNRTTQGLWTMGFVISNHGQVTMRTPEMAFPLLTSTPHQWEDV